MSNFPTSVGTNIQTILFRADTAANWQANNPTLGAGEPGFETDTGLLKIGNGSTAFNSLPYQTPSSIDGNNTLIQVRRATTAAWVTANPILASGEWGYEDDSGKAKLGDGVTAWNSLAYFGGGGGGGITSINGSTAASQIIAPGTNITIDNTTPGTTVINATGGSGTLAGDVTGPSGSNTVALVGGASAASVATSVATVAAATASATANAVMKRDGSGGVAASTFTGNLAGNATSSTSATSATTAGFATTAGTATSATNFSGSLSGDVTGTQGATAIASNAVTNAKLAQMATHTIKGNATGGTANAADLTGTQVTALLDIFSNTLKGLVPPSGGGTTTFLRADGTWAAGVSGVTSVNGDVGPAVSLTTTAIPEGTNLYYTDARVLAYATDAATSNSVVRRDGFGASSFGAVTAATLTGNLSSTSTLDTVPIASILSGAAAGNSATALATSNTIAERDDFGALVATGFSGGDLNGNALNVTGVVQEANGGTGQSNFQASLNNLTNVAASSNGDVLQSSGGNAVFAPMAVSYAAINAAIGAPTNSFIFSDGTSQIVGYSQWNIDPTTKFANVQLTYQPNNLAVNPQAFIINVNVDPLQNSPNDTVQIASFNANLDSSATGFNLGTAGDAAQLINGGFNYGGNGATYGRLRVISLYSGLGNGTDPFTFKGFSASNIGLTTNSAVTIDGQCTGYDFNLNLNAASISTANFSVTAFSDFSQIPIDLYGYQGLTLQPTISKIKDTRNFNGVNINPTIVDFEGNAGFYGFQVNGQITNQGTSNGYQGGQINTTITHLTQQSSGLFVGCQTTDGTANWQGINLTTNNINTTGDVKALSISTQPGHVAIDSQGRNNLQAAVSLVSGQGQMYGNVVGGQIIVPAGTAITGTDTIANNFAFSFDLGDAGSSWTAASVVGLTGVGYVGQLGGAGNAFGAINFCLGGYQDIRTGGHVDRVNNFFAAAIPAGAGTMGEAVLYLGDMPFGGVATDNWGVRIDDTPDILQNYLSRLAIGTANKKADPNTRLDVLATESSPLRLVTTYSAADTVNLMEGDPGAGNGVFLSFVETSKAGTGARIGSKDNHLELQNDRIQFVTAAAAASISIDTATGYFLDMTTGNSESVGITSRTLNAPDNSQVLAWGAKALELPNFANVTSPVEGMLAFNYTSHATTYYNGTSWV